MTCHVATVATNHSSSPHLTSQPTTLLHLTPQAISWHQNRSHYHRGTAESSFTAKKWFGHGAGRSPCAHSIGNFFLCYIVFFLLTLPPPARPGTKTIPYPKRSRAQFLVGPLWRCCACCCWLCGSCCCLLLLWLLLFLWLLLLLLLLLFLLLLLLLLLLVVLLALQLLNGTAVGA